MIARRKRVQKSVEERKAEQLARAAALEKKLSQVKARVQKLKAVEEKTERAKDTRRKILFGAWLQGRLEHDPEAAFFMRKLAETFPGFLQRKDDFDLFKDLLASLNPAGSHTGADGGLLPF